MSALIGWKGTQRDQIEARDERDGMLDDTAGAKLIDVNEHLILNVGREMMHSASVLPATMSLAPTPERQYRDHC